MAQLIEALEAVRRRPAMYFGAVEVEPAVAWLNGFLAATWTLLGSRDSFEVRRAVVESRGWEWSARHPSSEMVERGLTPGEVIDEMLSIEVEILRRSAAGPA